jgi:hypothetical protein
LTAIIEHRRTAQIMVLTEAQPITVDLGYETDLAIVDDTAEHREHEGSR